MYYILVYDIKEKRVQRVHKLLKRYLNWVQNSVFEGELTEGQFTSLKIELEDIMDEDEDSVIVYKLGSLKYTEREIIGIEKNLTDNLL
jgi:CRISPR-associated protein Cas2